MRREGRVSTWVWGTQTACNRKHYFPKGYLANSFSTACWIFAYNLELFFGQAANVDNPRKVMVIKQETSMMKFATAKPLQSYPTLFDPRDSSPPGSPVPGILQARTLEWVAISFSNAWKWKVQVKSLSRVWLLATPWTAAHQAPPSMGFSRQEYWSGVPLPSPIMKFSKKKYSYSLKIKLLTIVALNQLQLLFLHSPSKALIRGSGSDVCVVIKYSRMINNVNQWLTGCDAFKVKGGKTASLEVCIYF